MKIRKVEQKFEDIKKISFNYKKWIINYFISTDSLSNIISCFNHYYFISSNINEIHQWIYNQKRNFVCLCICLSCFLSILFSTTIICSNRLYNIFKENYSEVPQFKQIIILGITGLILTFAIRIDLIIEERKFQLRNLKFIYYLIHNLKSKHKFNDKNYKRILIVASTMELFMVKFVVFTIVTVTLLHFLSCVIHEIITFNNNIYK